MAWSTPPRHDAFLTVYMDTKCRPSYGVASTVVSVPAVCRAQLCVSLCSVNANVCSSVRPTTSLLKPTQRQRLRSLRNSFLSTAVVQQLVKTSTKAALQAATSSFSTKAAHRHLLLALKTSTLLFDLLTKSHTARHQSLHLLRARCSKKLAVSCDSRAVK